MTIRRLLVFAAILAGLGVAAPAHATGATPPDSRAPAPRVDAGAPTLMRISDVRDAWGASTVGAMSAAAGATSTPLRASAHDPSASGGYWMFDRDGTIYPFGLSADFGSWAGQYPQTGNGLIWWAVDIEPSPTGQGYLLLDAIGRVEAFGDAVNLGDAVGRTDAAGLEAAASLSLTPTGRGYWIFTTRGRVLAFGDAEHFGDMDGIPLNGPVLDASPTPSGRGYWMVAHDGGVFSFGDARFFGSMGATPLNSPVVGMAPDPDGTGYWLVAGDGGVFAFDAPFKNSIPGVLTDGQQLARPINGMVPYGDAYLMVASDGGVFNFATDLAFLGSLPPVAPSMAVTRIRAFPEDAIPRLEQTALAVVDQAADLGRLDIEVVAATITNEDASTFGTQSRKLTPGRHRLIVDVDVTNPTTASRFFQDEQVGLRLDGSGDQITPSGNTFRSVASNSTERIRFVFSLPTSAAPGATLVLGSAGVEKAVLPITSPVAGPSWPRSVALSGTVPAVTGRSGCTIDVQARSAAWDLEWSNANARSGVHVEPERGFQVPSGERFLTVSVRLSNLRAEGTCGRSVHQMLADDARLVIDGRSTAPDHHFVARLGVAADLDLDVTFRVPTDASTLQFRFGSGSPAAFTIPLPGAGLAR